MIIRTDGKNQDFLLLIKCLDENLAQINGEEQEFFTSFNQVNNIGHVVVYFVDNVPVACGAFKEYEKGICEIKRMFVKEEFRNKGVASLVLKELESWAKEVQFTEAILETGKKMSGAVALYKKNNYQVTENYGQYKEIESSVCFRKKL